MQENQALKTNSAPSASAILLQDTQLLNIVDNALADAASRSGVHLACRPGCTQCCHGAFAISSLDALRLRAAMAELANTNPAQAREITRRATLYLTEFSPSFPGNPATGILDESEAAQAAFEDFANEAPCPALDPITGLCDLYAARPMTCRVFGPPVRTESDGAEGFSICELCFTEASEEEIAAAEMHVPHQQEHQILDQIHPNPGETIVAFCLTPNH